MTQDLPKLAKAGFVDSVGLLILLWLQKTKARLENAAYRLIRRIFLLALVGKDSFVSDSHFDFLQK